MNAGCQSLRRDLARLNESGPELKATELHVSHQQLPVAPTLTRQPSPPAPHTPQYKDSPAASTSAPWVSNCAGRPLFLRNYNSTFSLDAVSYITYISFFCFPSMCSGRIRRWEVHTDVCCKSKVSRRGQSDDSLSSRERNMRKRLRFL